MRATCPMCGAYLEANFPAQWSCEHGVLRTGEGCTGFVPHLPPAFACVASPPSQTRPKLRLV